MPRAKKIWVKAESWVTEATLEVAQSAFLEASAIGIEIDDGVLPEGKRKFPEGRILLRAYFEEADAVAADIETTVARFFTACDFAMPTIDFADFVEDDWQGNFVKSCTTFKVEPDIYIVPSFEIEAFHAKPQGDLFIEMDPENAFGTGQHQTTKLCLTALRNLISDQSPTCLDVGTGSGILAILMKKLGAKAVLATETDGDALETAARNAKKNGVELEFLWVNETHNYDTASYDVVVANILAPVLIAMATNLVGCLKPAGHLLLSGILLAQAHGVIEAYEACGLKLLRQDKMDDWCALLFFR